MDTETTDGLATGPLRGLTGFLQSFGQSAAALAGIADSGAQIAGSVADGRGAIEDQQDRSDRSNLDLYTGRLFADRGDNVRLYAVVGVAAVALVFLFRKG